jgi:hypothetical protein
MERTPCLLREQVEELEETSRPENRDEARVGEVEEVTEEQDWSNSLKEPRRGTWKKVEVAHETKGQATVIQESSGTNTHHAGKGWEQSIQKNTAKKRQELREGIVHSQTQNQEVKQHTTMREGARHCWVVVRPLLKIT